MLKDVGVSGWTPIQTFPCLLYNVRGTMPKSDTWGTTAFCGNSHLAVPAKRLSSFPLLFATRVEEVEEVC